MIFAGGIYYMSHILFTFKHVFMFADRFAIEIFNNILENIIFQ